MMKSKKVISMVCVLAMILSMFSAFCMTASAATQNFTVGISDEDAVKKAQGDEITLNFSTEGFDNVVCIELYIPEIKSDKFEIASSDVGTLNAAFQFKDKGLCYDFISMADSTNYKGSEKLASVTLRLKENITTSINPTVKGLSVVNEDTTTKVQTAYGNGDDCVAMPINNNAVIGKVEAQMGLNVEVAQNKEEGTVTLNFSNTSKLAANNIVCIELYIPEIKSDKFEIASSDVGTLNAAFQFKDKGLCYDFISMADSTNYTQTGKFASVTLKLKDGVTLTDDIALSVKGCSFVNEDATTKAQTAYGNGDDCEPMDMTVGTIKANPATTYTVTVADAENGTVAVDKATAAENDKVTITATPSEGYVLDAITVTDADNNKVTVADDNTFTMPAKNVTVKVTFKVSGGSTEDAYKLTVSASNATVTLKDADNNIVKSGASVKVGTVLTVTVEPNTNYTVSAVKFNNTALTANEDGTYTITMPNKVSSLSVTTTKNSSYEFTADVDPIAGTKLGRKYEVTFKDNASFTGTKHDKFDVVVQVYNSSKVAAGYMIFKDVTTTDTVTFYIPKNSTASVNFVDELNDSSNSLGTVIAQKIEKK